jgi:hypothetical protein
LITVWRSKNERNTTFATNMEDDRMRTRSLFFLGGALLLIAANAFAGPKEDVAAATAKWGETLGQDDPDKVLALYAPDAVLWGTLSPTVRSDRAALRDYFVSAFKILPGLKVSFGEQLIRVYGDTAVNTGYYTFAYTRPRGQTPLTMQRSGWLARWAMKESGRARQLGEKNRDGPSGILIVSFVGVRFPDAERV